MLAPELVSRQEVVGFVRDVVEGGRWTALLAGFGDGDSVQFQFLRRDRGLWLLS